MIMACPEPQNFVTSILDAQFADRLVNHDGTLSDAGRIDWGVNLLFTSAFTVELILNVFANWLDRFVGNGWNWFDIVIVSISHTTSASPTSPTGS